MKVKSKQTSEITKNFQLNSSTIESIHQYAKDRLKPAAEAIYKCTNDIEIVRGMAKIDTYDLREICEETIEEQPMIDFLMTINSILVSDDIEFLEKFDFFRNALNGTVYPKPKTMTESLHIVHAMRVIIQNDYAEIVKQIEIDHAVKLSSDISH